MAIIITKEERNAQTDDITLRPYEYEGNAMIEFSGAFRPFSLSENKILRVLKCAEELKQIFATSAKAQTQQEKTERAKNIEKQSLDNQAREMTKKANVTDNPQKTYKPGTFTDFVSWMQSVYNVDASQARQWITDAEYQAEYQAYLKENEISAQRPTKRATSPERPQKRVDAPAKERTSGGKEVSFSVIVNGKTLLMSANNKSQAIDKLNALEKSLTRASDGKTRLIENDARTIRENGSSPSHLFDELVKQQFVTLD